MEHVRVGPLGTSGLKTSNIGVGTSGLSGLHGEMDEEEAKQAILFALQNGVNFIDTAPFYNERRAELRLGQLIDHISRERVNICTKVGRYMDLTSQSERFEYTADATMASVKTSLQTLRLSYLDLILIHDIEFAPSLKLLQEETIPCLVKLKDEGLIRSIGISGYSTRHLRAVADVCCRDIDVVMSYFRHNLYDDSLQQDLSFYQSRGIGVINASPLGIGLFANNGNVPSWNPASPEVVKACKKAGDVCSSYGVSLSKLALRHSVETDGISMTLWSSRSVAHMKSNISDTLTPLNDKELSARKKVMELFQPVHNMHWEHKLNEYRQFWSL